MSESDHPTGRQIAAARALAGIGQDELAAAARISVPTLRRMETSLGAASGMANNVAAVRSALEAAGVIFVAENGEGPGVRLRREPFKHDVEHLHRLWSREGGSITMRDGISIETIPSGLVCLGRDRREIGHVFIVDGELSIEPMPFAPTHHDRLLPTELRRWAEAAQDSD